MEEQYAKSNPDIKNMLKEAVDSEYANYPEVAWTLSRDRED